MIPNPVTQAIALVNQISQLLLPTVIPIFDIKLRHPLRRQHLFMLPLIDQTAIIVIEVQSMLHGERRKCSQLMLDGRMGRVLSSSFYVAARICVEQIIDLRDTLRYLGVTIQD